MPSLYTASREQFELRMRARRAATCLALARSAAAAGRPAEAVERLEEACALDSGAVEARLLLDELRGQDAGVAPRPEMEARPRSEFAGWSHWLAAAIAICALAALAFLWPTGRQASPGGTPAREVPAARPGHSPTFLGGGDVPAGLAAELPVTVGTSGSGAVQGSDPRGSPPGLSPDALGRVDTAHEGAVTQVLPFVPRTDSAAGGVQAASGSVPVAVPPPVDPGVGASSPTSAPGSNGVVPPTRDPRPSPPAGEGTPVPTLAARPPAASLPPLERVLVSGENPAALVPSEAVTSAPLAPSAKPTDVPAEASLLRSDAADAGEVETALRRYAEAYSRLDAAAARAVWPTLDERALARAFSGLASQTVAFDHCDIDVAGLDARAACRGRAQFVPRVGSQEPLVQRREWAFRLKRAASGWQITSVEAR
jgi:hypothetical protein